MGSTYQAGYDVAVQTGLSNAGTWELELQESDTTLFPVSGNNPQSPPQSVWNNNGSLVEGIGSTWESSGNNTLARVMARVPDSNSNQQQFVLWDSNDGGDLSYSATNGEDLTITGGELETLDPGYAEILVSGIGNIQAKYVLKDGNGNALSNGGTVSPGDSNHVSWNFVLGTPRRMEIGSNLVFTNNSGGSWSAEEIEVQTNTNSNVIVQDSSFSYNIPDGGSLTFTVIQDEVTNLQ